MRDLVNPAGWDTDRDGEAMLGYPQRREISSRSPESSNTPRVTQPPTSRLTSNYSWWTHSVLADALPDDGSTGDQARAELTADDQWAAPDHIFVAALIEMAIGRVDSVRLIPPDLGTARQHDRG